jgi:hypothetical protein
MHMVTRSNGWTKIFGRDKAKKLDGKFSDGRFPMPENFDVVEVKYDTRFCAGANDWEQAWTAICGETSTGDRVWFEIAYEEGSHPGSDDFSDEQAVAAKKRCEKILKDWIEASVASHKKSFDDGKGVKRLSKYDLAEGLSGIADDIKKYGLEYKTYKPIQEDPADFGE